MRWQKNGKSTASKEFFRWCNVGHRAQDLSCYNFILWGYPKSKVYNNKPRNLVFLWADIEQESSQIPASMLKKVIANFKKLVENVDKNRGGHLSDIVFKTK